MREKLKEINNHLDNSPSPANIKKASKNISSQLVKLRLAKKYANRQFDKMTYDEKRTLVESVFSGKTADGKRMGVYVCWNKDSWTFDIKGRFIDESGLKPWTETFQMAEVLASRFLFYEILERIKRLKPIPVGYD